MISTEDLYKELTKYDELTKDDVDVSDVAYKKAMIKLSILNAKLMGNIRTNIVNIMKHFNINLMSSKNRRPHGEKKDTEKKG